MKREEYVDLLKKNACSVTFTKTSDGSERTMECTLSPEILPAVQAATVEGAGKPINENVIAVWDLGVGAWRSFRVDSVVSFDISDGRAETEKAPNDEDLEVA